MKNKSIPKSKVCMSIKDVGLWNLFPSKEYSMVLDKETYEEWKLELLSVDELCDVRLLFMQILLLVLSVAANDTAHKFVDVYKRFQSNWKTYPVGVKDFDELVKSVLGYCVGSAFYKNLYDNLIKTHLAELD